MIQGNSVRSYPKVAGWQWSTKWIFSQSISDRTWRHQFELLVLGHEKSRKVCFGL